MTVISVFNVNSVDVVGVYLDEKTALENYPESDYVFKSHTLNEKIYVAPVNEAISDSRIQVIHDDSLIDNYMIMDSCDIIVNGNFTKNSFNAVKLIAENYIEFNPSGTVIILTTNEFPDSFFLVKDTTSYDDDDGIEFYEFLESKKISIS